MYARMYLYIIHYVKLNLQWRSKLVQIFLPNMTDAIFYE